MKLRDHLELYPFLRLVVVLMAGIVAADNLGEGVSDSCWRWLLLAFLALTVVAKWFREGVRPWSQSVLLLLTVFFLGATLTRQAHRRLHVELSAGAVSYGAVVVSEPQVRGKTLRMDLLVTRLDGRPLPRPVRVRASLLRDTLSSRWQQVRLGSGIRAYSTFEPIRSQWQSGHFDYARWAQVHGYQAQTFIYYRDWESSRPDFSLLSTLQRARLRALVFRQHLLHQYRALGLDDQQYAVVAAMTLGDKSALSQVTKDRYAITGASHVLALSGLHLGIVYAILTLLLGGGRRMVWGGHALVLCALWSYVMLVGFPASVVRSAAMLTVYAGCKMLGRDAASANALAFAALAMLVVNPLSLWDIGFQLSFLAVLGILAYQRWLYHLWNPPAKLLRWVWGLVTVSLAAQVATAPVVAYYFGRFSCYFLLTNFLVVPVATVILYGTIALLLATPFMVVAKVLASALASMADFLNMALGTIASWPGASVEGINISLAQVVLLYVMLVSLTVIVAYVCRLRVLGALDTFNRSARKRDSPAPNGDEKAIDDAGLEYEEMP